ncbi:hypothetical protein [Spiroplasma endosymbiont of Tipula paludosa]|uniref:hypothetical protein n=1 Tax=Spiroplasma endosymbiont of Tipula paludosa TaxID=3066295 RepID=UPI0035C8CB2C
MKIVKSMLFLMLVFNFFTYRWIVFHNINYSQSIVNLRDNDNIYQLINKISPILATMINEDNFTWILPNVKEQNILDIKSNLTYEELDITHTGKVTINIPSFKALLFYYFFKDVKYLSLLFNNWVYKHSLNLEENKVLLVTEFLKLMKVIDINTFEVSEDNDENFSLMLGFLNNFCSENRSEHLINLINSFFINNIINAKMEGFTSWITLETISNPEQFTGGLNLLIAKNIIEAQKFYDLLSVVALEAFFESNVISYRNINNNIKIISTEHYQRYTKSLHFECYLPTVFSICTQ